MIIWLYYLLMLLFCFAGLFLVLLTLPGLWLMLASAALYARLTGHLGFRSLLALLALAMVGELLELVVGGVTTRRSGGGGLTIFGAGIGAVLGGIFLTFIPIPVIGTLIGVCLGSFLGATLVELLRGKRLGRSLRVGMGAGFGRFGGMVVKIMIGIVMLLLILIAGFP